MTARQTPAQEMEFLRQLDALVVNSEPFPERTYRPAYPVGGLLSRPDSPLEQHVRPRPGPASRLQRRPQRPVFPTPTRNCDDCHKSRVTYNPFGDRGRWCHLCYRFRVSAAALRTSHWCSCPCDCTADPTLAPEDEAAMSTDSDFEPDSTESDSSVISSSTESRPVDSTTAMTLAAELNELSRPPPQPTGDYERDRAAHVDWESNRYAEIMDFEFMGHSPTTLRRQFPELFAHSLPRRPGQFNRCSICHQERMWEVERALDVELILLCFHCDRPVVRHAETVDFSILDLNACLCYCSCHTEPPRVCTGPLWMPFPASNFGVTPSPITQNYLRDRGFCARNLEGERIRAAVAANVAKPSYVEVITNTIPDFLMPTFGDQLRAVYNEQRTSTTFPNGEPRNPDTISGLSVALETALRLIDPNAFGHLTRAHNITTWTQAQALNAEEQDRWARILYARRPRYREQGTPREGGPKLLAWATQYEHDFELGDEDGDSVCSIEYLDRDLWEQLQEQPQCDCGRDYCPFSMHQARHFERRLKRVADRGDFPYTPEDLEYATDIEGHYLHDRETFSALEIIADLRPRLPVPRENRDSGTSTVLSGNSSDNDSDHDDDNEPFRVFLRELRPEGFDEFNHYSEGDLIYKMREVYMGYMNGHRELALVRGGAVLERFREALVATLEEADDGEASASNPDLDRILGQNMIPGSEINPYEVYGGEQSAFSDTSSEASSSPNRDTDMLDAEADPNPTSNSNPPSPATDHVSLIDEQPNDRFPEIEIFRQILHDFGDQFDMFFPDRSPTWLFYQHVQDVVRSGTILDARVTELEDEWVRQESGQYRFIPGPPAPVPDMPSIAIWREDLDLNQEHYARAPPGGTSFNIIFQRLRSELEGRFLTLHRAVAVLAAWQTHEQNLRRQQRDERLTRFQTQYANDTFPELNQFLTDIESSWNEHVQTLQGNTTRDFGRQLILRNQQAGAYTPQRALVLLAEWFHRQNMADAIERRRQQQLTHQQRQPTPRERLQLNRVARREANSFYRYYVTDHPERHAIDFPNQTLDDVFTENTREDQRRGLLHDVQTRAMLDAWNNLRADEQRRQQQQQGGENSTDTDNNEYPEIRRFLQFISNNREEGEEEVVVSSRYFPTAGRTDLFREWVLRRYMSEEITEERVARLEVEWDRVVGEVD